jgi:hypothetical protein
MDFFQLAADWEQSPLQEGAFAELPASVDPFAIIR